MTLTEEQKERIFQILSKLDSKEVDSVSYSKDSFLGWLKSQLADSEANEFIAQARAKLGR